MNKIVILHMAGYGDFLSFLTRCKSIKEKHSDHEIVFYFGGWGKSPILCKEQATREGYKSSVIKNFTNHSQVEYFKEWLKKSILKDGDMLIDACFCAEIFNNETPSFISNYDMEDFYKYKTEYYPHIRLRKYLDEPNRCKNLKLRLKYKYVIINPITSSGSPEGFDVDLQQGRFLSKEKWVSICRKLYENEFTPMLVGINDEDYGLKEALNKEVEYFDAMGLSVEETIALIQEYAQGCIATNSWLWEVAARNRIPTVCIYTKNTFFLPVHLPQRSSEIYNNLYVETNVNAEVQDVFDKFMYLYEHHKKPDVKYSICNIARSDKETIKRTLDNIELYINNEFVSVIDSKSSDGTKNILYSFQNKVGVDKVKVIEREWKDNFEIQKNASLENAKNNYILFIDSDETYEHHFLNQINWCIWEMQNKNIDCISIPRKNILDGLSDQELLEFCQSRGWNMSGFKWINYEHDAQKRLFNKNVCQFRGETHEQVIGAKKEFILIGNHIIHRKSIDKQKRDLQREELQYELTAKKVKERIYKDE